MALFPKRRRPAVWPVVALAGLGGAFSARAAEEAPAPPAASANACRLLLPDWIPAAVGCEANIYFDNIVLTGHRRDTFFDVTCARGRQQEERWTFTPTAEDVGEYPWSVQVRDEENRLIASGQTTIRVVPADAGKDQEVRFLIIGDSLTSASRYPEEILTLCQAPGNPRLTLLGTNQFANFSPGNRHEGYGGWTFRRFLTYWEPDPNPADYRKRGSPFVFLEDDQPRFNFRRYVAERCEGRAPDFVSIALGCNDIFAATEETLEETITTVLADAERLIAGVREAGPQTRIGLVMLVPPAASQDAFGASYGCGQTRRQYRRNQHRFVECLLERYRGREGEGLYLIPAYVNLDTVRNYPSVEGAANARSEVRIVRQANGVHPADAGYRQMADTIYSWMKMVLATPAR